MHARIAIACAASLVGAAVVAAQDATPRDGAAAELLSTIIAGLQAREESIPPLTACGVWRAFYTPLYWSERRRELSRHPGARENPVEYDRAAVALALWVSPDGEEWVREFQGLYRGPNTWVYPMVEMDPRRVSDLYRIEHGTRDGVEALDLNINGYPTVYRSEPSTGRPHGRLGVHLGLVGPSGPLGERLAGLGADSGWRVGPIEESGDVYTIRRGYYDEGNADVVEALLEVDAARGFAPLRYRYVISCVEGGGRATECVWSDLRDLGPDANTGQALCVAGRWASWDFNYFRPGEGPLQQTETFKCLSVTQTEPTATRPPLPMCALPDEIDPDTGEPKGGGLLFGLRVRTNVRGFADENPPPPPEDLLRLDIAAERERILTGYGFR
jgi:hypothetical protein